MSDFHNVRFPLSLAFGASGGPDFQTQITQLANGREHRNTPYAQPRRRFEALIGLKSIDQCLTLMSFFHARRGRLHSFRFKDPFDYKSCQLDASPSATDQFIGTGDGVQTVFQLKKTEGVEPSFNCVITKPVAGTVVIAVDGVIIDPSDFSVADVTGLVTLSTAPTIGASVTAGFEFDRLVRFDTDFLDLTLDDFGAGHLKSLPIVEVPDA